MSALPLPVARALAPARAARWGGFAALAVWGASRWARLVAPPAPARLGGMLLLAAAWAAALWALRDRGRLARGAAWALGGVIVLAGMLLLAGIPSNLVLSARNWSALGSGLGQGVQGLPNATTPYDGADEWVRWVTLAGGGLLLAAGAATLARLPLQASLAARVWAAAPLVLLAAIPAVVLSDRAGVAEGAVLFLTLLAACWLEQLPAAGARAALVLALGAAGVGLALGSAVDARHPWLHYDRLVTKLDGQTAETFSWTHRYGPLDWVRTGREVLRVKMTRPVYLKAENLDAFDGVRWKPAEVHPAADERSELPAHPPRRWFETLGITFRNLGSSLVIGSGATLGVSHSPVRTVGTGSPGTFSSVAPLRPGSSYRVTVYAPTPSPASLAAEPADYPDWTDAYRELVLAGPQGRVDVQFDPYGSGTAPLVLERSGRPRRTYAQVLGSSYGPAYRLARRLERGAATPYDYVARVRRYLRQKGFRYDEHPAAGGLPLERFLFTDHRGYCQQFSGAMALLLRMAGIPARVSSGFTSGYHDKIRTDWVVRDYDAHSWVEVWFPREGWVTFDPTPPAAPALTLGLVKLGPGDAPALFTRHRLTAGDKGPGRARAGRSVTGLVGAGLGAALLIAALVSVGVRLWRSRRQDPIGELVDALRRCGRELPPDFTLRQLERRLRREEDARAYVGALREQRYGWPEAGPTTAGRRALRRELAHGLGLGGRLRALWALPPRRHSGWGAF